MRRINTGPVLEKLEDLIAPSHTALLIHDMQNDFCAPGGKLFDRAGAASAATRKVVERIGAIVAEARRVGVTVAYSRASHFPGGEDESPAHVHHLLRRGQRGQEPNVVIGTWGHQIVEELTPKPGDFVFDKFAFSVFHGTIFEKMLRMWGVKTIVFAGVASHGGVLTSARIATVLDYYVAVVRECVGGLDEKLHEAAVRVLEPDVYGSTEILNAWRVHAAAGR